LVYKQIGKKIKEFREIQKITQEDLAEGLGVSIQQLHKYETGKNKISIEKLLILAKRFNVDLNFFVEGMTWPDNEEYTQMRVLKNEVELIGVSRRISKENLRKHWIAIGEEIARIK
jgi:transcriptional regulator with XRE-family HTH domain